MFALSALTSEVTPVASTTRKDKHTQSCLVKKHLSAQTALMQSDLESHQDCIRQKEER
jgi:alcohol dehydrogenase class IV